MNHEADRPTGADAGTASGTGAEWLPTVAALVDREAIRELVQRSAALLDAEAYESWTHLFAAGGQYELVADSPEIRSRMVWWRNDRDEMARVLAEVPSHVNDPASRLHLVTVDGIDLAGPTATCTARFALFRTQPDGATRLYLVGRYELSLVKDGARWLFGCYRTVLETRMLEPAMHVPV